MVDVVLLMVAWLAVSYWILRPWVYRGRWNTWRNATKALRQDPEALLWTLLRLPKQMNAAEKILVRHCFGSLWMANRTLRFIKLERIRKRGA